jgi:hypothetical protein
MIGWVILVVVALGLSAGAVLVVVRHRNRMYQAVEINRTARTKQERIDGIAGVLSQWLRRPQ